MNKFKGIFDSYWNENEFVTFDPDDVILSNQLKEALKPKTENLYLQYFDIKAYPYQIEILDELKAVGCDSARSVLEIGKDDLVKRTDLEAETIDEVLSILQAEFE